ncbi:MAG: FecR domain-containing protein [Prolixibacteraceae bacterium]|jgi:ferric-dicitrate binding protein FerR (iron transport regulator)
MSEENFHKILSGTASEVEKKEFYTSIKNDPEKRDDFLYYKNLYSLSNYNRDEYQEKQQESFTKFWTKVQDNRKKINIYAIMRYAAVIVLAASVGYLVNYRLDTEDEIPIVQHIEYSSEKGSVSSIHLDDGSVIWLSSGTKLILNKNAKGKTIAKLDGEAFFDLKPDSTRRFFVDLGHFKVRDIGTKFNIRAYKEEQTISTSLIEGQIDLVKKYHKPFLNVKPGELVQYNKSDRRLTVNKQDTSIIAAWKDGKFVFIDKTLAEICRELENWYNIEIEITDNRLAGTKYTSVIKRTTTVKMVLQILALTDNIHYDIIDKKEGKDIIKIRK